ncbi:MAG: cation diffusion facilitator family transporter [Thiothrix sp.]|uniref:cation diffusion facilitator family transporter n=1 Tax=Thiothrix sp. TaxID=1032 RepID=UPI002603EB3C|nr:cation diffusion facilitator family transporter [Thiothrix sp.]MDD5393204.1 cation diffusion facilitator family transporter [Thiothrix sp.]
MEHSHDHHHAPSSFNLAFGLGIALNLGFVGIEAFFGWKINSLALLADAGHNLSDVAGLVVAWGGMLAGGLAADVRHTYGWKRASILAAFTNALLLLVVMGSLMWESVGRVGSSIPPDGYTIMWVASVGVVINTLTALLFMRGSEDLNIRGAFLHMAADALVSIGVVISGALALWFGWGWLDPLVSLAIAIIIVLGTWGLFHQSLHLLFDGVPHHISLPAVKAHLEALPGVEQVHDLHIWALGTSEVALTAHLLMPADSPGDQFLTDLAAALREQFGIHHPTVQIETVAAECGCHQHFPVSHTP